MTTSLVLKASGMVVRLLLVFPRKVVVCWQSRAVSPAAWVPVALQQPIRVVQGSVAGASRLPAGSSSGPGIQPEICPSHRAPLHPLLLPGRWAGTPAVGMALGRAPLLAENAFVSPPRSST